MVIDRYRATTAALGYTGDSVINSLSDIAMMMLGFLLARKLPLWAAIAVLIALEIIPLFAIRDNLTLNVLGVNSAQRTRFRRGRPPAEGTIGKTKCSVNDASREKFFETPLQSLAGAFPRRRSQRRAGRRDLRRTVCSRRQDCRSTIPGSKAAPTYRWAIAAARSVISGSARCSPMCSARVNTAGNTNYARCRHIGQISISAVPGTSVPASGSPSTPARPANSTAPTRSLSAAGCCSSPRSASARSSTIASVSRRAGCT